uniref:Uncharacterized protein n=1 Tax=Hyaloperonospora arabidopsidis (strain Emoy2) TaxID=559515 RepID=M4BEE9_HYAAE
MPEHLLVTRASYKHQSAALLTGGPITTLRRTNTAVHGQLTEKQISPSKPEACTRVSNWATRSPPPKVLSQWVGTAKHFLIFSLPSNVTKTVLDFAILDTNEVIPHASTNSQLIRIPSVARNFFMHVNCWNRRLSRRQDSDKCDGRSSPRRYDRNDVAPSRSHSSRLAYRYVVRSICKSSLRWRCLRLCGLHFGLRTYMTCLKCCHVYQPLHTDVYVRSRVHEYNLSVDMHVLDFVGSVWSVRHSRWADNANARWSEVAILTTLRYKQMVEEAGISCGHF